MNKFWLSFFVIGSFALYAISYGNNGPLSYVATPVAEVGKKTTTDTQNTTNTQVVQPPFSFFGNDDSNPFGENSTPRTTLVSTPKTTTTTKPNTTLVSTPKTIPVVTTPPKPKGLYTDGTYTGSNEYAYSGYVKVTAVISNGRLSNIQYPATEAGPRTSQRIYDYSMPQLKSEAISAQSANINGVSGATYTSDAFKQSLAYALTQAKN